MEIISALYSTVSFIVAAAYMPQIMTLIKTRTDCRDISLWAWLMWDYTAIVSFLYSTLILQDLKFALVCTANVLCINTVIGLVLYKRAKYSK